MARLSVVVRAVFLLVVLLDGVLSSAGAAWSYSGDGDPSHWSKMDGNAACGGQMQSPIDIITKDVKYNASLAAFEMNGYDTVQGKLTLHNNGHSAQVDTTEANWTVTAGSLTDTYRLLQFHFHWGKDSNTGSEHTINSKQYPLEMHMVHMSIKYDIVSDALKQDKSLTVVTLMFEVGPNDNPAFKNLTDNLENVKHSGENETLPTFMLRPLMPSNLADYYTYDGSLTTPPCSEVVVWNIFRETVKISEAQLAHFRALMNYKNGDEAHGGGNGPLVDNFRPVTALNGRTVFSSFSYNGHIASAGDHWGYAHGGAKKWSKENKDCSLKHQSPIDIKVSDAKYDQSLGAFTVTGYSEKQGVLTLKNNGHSAQVDTTDGNWTVSGGSLKGTYNLLQFHFHWGSDSKTGSEHTIDSKRYPLEMHMVHMSENFSSISDALSVDRSLTVLGIMFEVGKDDNAVFKQLTDELENVVYKDQMATLDSDIRKLMPSSLADYYTYEGSLTTPPCSEVVVWNIFRQTVKISEKQLDAFRALRIYKKQDEKVRGQGLEKGFMYDNYRPLQKLNGRMVRKNFVMKTTPGDKKMANSANVVSACLTVLLTSLLATRVYLL